MNAAGRSQSFVGLEVRPLIPLQANTLYTATLQRVENVSGAIVPPNGGVPMVGAHSWHYTPGAGRRCKT